MNNSALNTVQRTVTITKTVTITAPTNDKGSLGFWLWKFRMDKNLSLRAAAKLANVSASTLSRVEGNTMLPDLRTFACLCKWAAIDPRDALILLKIK